MSGLLCIIFTSLLWIFQTWHCLQPLDGPVSKQQLMTQVTGEEIWFNTSKMVCYDMIPFHAYKSVVLTVCKTWQDAISKEV